MSRSLTCLFSTSKRNVGRLAWCKRRDNFQFIYTSKKYSTSHSSVDLPIIIPTKGVPIHLYTNEIEPDVMTQLQVLAESPLPTGHIAVMPDVHLGEGVAIGTVFASEKYICPNAVGVDIGCGVAAVPIEGLYLHDLSHANRLEIQRRLKERIPTGFEQRRSMWEGAKNILDDISNELKPSSYLEDQLHLPRVTDQLGTLGGGNHFLEVVHNASDGQVWAMLHSGSRNVGNRVARHYDQAAQHYLQTEEGIDIKSLKGLHYMPIDSTQGFDYIQDMVWCQKYAFHNRRIMKQVMLEIIEQVTGRVPDMTKAINVHHNFCACETCNGRKLWITRKGATSAKMGQFGLIPGSMGTVSLNLR